MSHSFPFPVPLSTSTLIIAGWKRAADAGNEASCGREEEKEEEEEEGGERERERERESIYGRLRLLLTTVCYTPVFYSHALLYYT